MKLQGKEQALIWDQGMTLFIVVASFTNLKILDVANIHAPIIHKRIRGFRNCPWITSQIKRGTVFISVII